MICHRQDCQEDCKRCQEDALDRQVSLSDVADPDDWEMPWSGSIEDKGEGER